jgi:hypothetical protein
MKLAPLRACTIRMAWAFDHSSASPVFSNTLSKSPRSHGRLGKLSSAKIGIWHHRFGARLAASRSMRRKPRATRAATRGCGSNQRSGLYTRRRRAFVLPLLGVTPPPDPRIFALWVRRRFILFDTFEATLPSSTPAPSPIVVWAACWLSTTMVGFTSASTSHATICAGLVRSQLSRGSDERPDQFPLKGSPFFVLTAAIRRAYYVAIANSQVANPTLVTGAPAAIDLVFAEWAAAGVSSVNLPHAGAVWRNYFSLTPLTPPVFTRFQTLKTRARTL